jgi:RNA polymerase sigma factor (sigma-70 family)
MTTPLTKSPKTIGGHLRRAVLLRDQHVLTDSRLLESFRADGDETAFEILVKRHGPMVLGVCRRVIGNRHDAEDAFQAVFLVLAKKAASIARCDLIGNWLYGVAYRTALQARGRLGRRRAQETPMKDMPQPAVAPEYDLHELHQVLDRELSKLTDKYRVPIVLCDLEGRPRKEVARLLKIPEGTLSSRLATARQHLARRLARHGLWMSAGALAMALAQQAATAAVRTGLVSVSAKAASLTAAGRSVTGILSAPALALSQGALKTMLLNKLKVISLVCLGLVAGGVGAGLGVPKLMAQPAQADQPSQTGEAGRPKADDQEPIEGALLLDEQIQKHLQLSPNQINTLQAVSRDVDGKNDAKHQEIERLQKRIEELQQHMAQLQKSINKENQQIGKVRENIERDRTRALGQAAPDILSARAIQRVREIQRQHRGLRALLQDPKVQQMLKVDDEQVRKIEGILKKEAEHWQVYAHVDGGLSRMGLGVALADYDSDGHPDMFITGQEGWFLSRGDLRRLAGAPNLLLGHAVRKGQLYLNLGGGLYAHQRTTNDRSLMDVLTDAQKKTLLDWVGKPYTSPSWQELWKQYGKKGT